ncbi:MAG: hypothetical protein ABIR70_13310 [Bryobacteraceae bacterium]
MRLLLLCSFVLTAQAATNVTVKAKCDEVKGYVVTDVEEPLLPVVKGNIMTFTKPVQDTSELMRKLGKLPPGSKSGHTTVYTFTQAGSVCVVTIALTSPIPRIAELAATSEQGDVNMIRLKFPK